MSQRIAELTDKVVHTFQESLSEQSKNTLSTNELDNLTMLVKEALTEHASAIVDDLQVVMDKLESDIVRPDIGL